MTQDNISLSIDEKIVSGIVKEATKELNLSLEANNSKIKATEEVNSTMKAEMLTLKAQADTMQTLIIQMTEAKKRNNAFADTYGDKSLHFMQTITQPTHEGYISKGLELGVFSDTNPEGGILVPKEMLNELLKDIFSEGSEQIASLPRTLTRKSKMVQVPTQTGRPVFTTSAECKPARCSSSKFHGNTLVAKKVSACFEASWEGINYQSTYGESEIISDLRNSLADYLSYQIINGLPVSNTGGYLGVLQDVISNGGRIEEFTSIGVGLTFDDLFNLDTELLMGQNPVILMDKRNRNVLNQLKGTDGQYIDPRFGQLPQIIITGKVQVGVPDPADPENLAIAEDVNLIPLDKVIIGDFNRGYLQLLVEDLLIIRDPYTKAKSACINWSFHHWSDGMPVLPDAFKVLNIQS